ncbi:hypothetical protein BC832DRAFT_537089 [Gaertneriomyces semiglobifer]|nr:hypothetical protein BC832DRAFT_537089 [Gaertneriomyces semiglobifer]
MEPMIRINTIVWQTSIAAITESLISWTALGERPLHRRAKSLAGGFICAICIGIRLRGVLVSIETFKSDAAVLTACSYKSQRVHVGPGEGQPRTLTLNRDEFFGTNQGHLDKGDAVIDDLHCKRLYLASHCDWYVKELAQPSHLKGVIMVPTVPLSRTTAGLEIEDLLLVIGGLGNDVHVVGGRLA